MSFKIEVQTGGPEWAGNAITLPTKEEAEDYGLDLFNRWMMATDYRVVTSYEPANYHFTDGVLVPFTTNEIVESFEFTIYHDRVVGVRRPLTVIFDIIDERRMELRPLGTTVGQSLIPGLAMAAARARRAHARGMS